MSLEHCCMTKALKGDFTDPDCSNNKSGGFDWKFWGIVLLIVIILSIIGFFVYKKFFSPARYANDVFYNNGANSGNENFGNENFGNENFGNENFGNENFGNENFGNENFGNGLELNEADLEILNMPVEIPAPSVSPAVPSVSPAVSSVSPAPSVRARA
jgi:hypothetical protein